MEDSAYSLDAEERAEASGMLPTVSAHIDLEGNTSLTLENQARKV